MKTSINPASLINKWLDNKRKSQLRIADYLDEISTEAESIATTWQEVAEDLKKCRRNPEDNPRVRSLIEWHGSEPHSNVVPYSRLSSFYENVSHVLGENNRYEIDPVIYLIGKILHKRNLTRELVDKELSRIKNAVFFDTATDINSIQSIDESVIILHKEAASLRVLASSFRAKIK